MDNELFNFALLNSTSRRIISVPANRKRKNLQFLWLCSSEGKKTY